MSRSFILLSIIGILPTLALGQVTGMSRPSSSKPSSSSSSAPSSSGGGSSSSVVSNNGNLFESSTSEKFADKIFDTNSDSVDWDKGSINWKGKTYSIGNSMVVRARFERYLATDMSSEGIDDYKNIISEILSKLSTQNRNATIKDQEYAWNLLFEAGDFPYDGSSSIAIANLVDTVWRMKSDRKELLRTEDRNEKAKANAITKATNLSNYLDTHGIASSSGGGKGGGKGGKGGDKGGSSSTPQAISSLDMTPLHGAADLTYATKDLALKEAELKKTQVATVAIGTKAVVQYQSMVVGFITARRFSHAIIACDFYREIFKGSKQEFTVGKKQMTEMIPVSNVIPSTDLIQTIAFEGRNDVIIGMQAVHALYDKGERYSALQRLMETFFLGENEADVMSFPYDKKQVLYSIYRDASTIKDLADARDLDGIEEKIKSIEKNTSDFPVAEIMAKVNAAKNASNLKLFAAKQSAFIGDMEAVERHITDATLIWPLNPAIAETNNEFMKMATGEIIYVKNFEKLVEAKNYREITKEAAEYGMAFRNNPDKQEELKEIVTKVASLDMLIAQSKEMQKQNNYYIAWEFLENAKKIEKDDIELARAIADLAPMVADYVMLINNAKLAEGKNRYPDALNNYLKAQKISPFSQTCREGIDRTSKLYLEGN